MPPARYANAPIALISLNYNLNYERAVLVLVVVRLYMVSMVKLKLPTVFLLDHSFNLVVEIMAQ